MFVRAENGARIMADMIGKLDCRGKNVCGIEIGITVGMAYIIVGAGVFLEMGGSEWIWGSQQRKIGTMGMNSSNLMKTSTD